MAVTEVVENTKIPGFPLRRGKVRDVYDLGDQILLVATDRISAYDVILPTCIPGKGQALTQLSESWFDRLASATPNHLIRVIQEQAPPGMEDHLDQLRGRATLCRKCEPVLIECVVRGYLAGSGWKEYRTSGSVCGISLPPGLRECEQLPEPIFTPSTKAQHGHDENISFAQAAERVGEDVMVQLRDRSLAIYEEARRHAASRGILIADTKFEFGLCDGETLLIDEVLTPDSSRFWPADRYECGRDQESFDKQYVRNYLTGLVEADRWDKNPPGPQLPDEIVRNTTLKYEQVCKLLIG